MLLPNINPVQYTNVACKCVYNYLSLMWSSSVRNNFLSDGVCIHVQLVHGWSGRAHGGRRDAREGAGLRHSVPGEGEVPGCHIPIVPLLPAASAGGPGPGVAYRNLR